MAAQVKTLKALQDSGETVQELLDMKVRLQEQQRDQSDRLAASEGQVQQLQQRVLEYEEQMQGYRNQVQDVQSETQEQSRRHAQELQGLQKEAAKDEGLKDHLEEVEEQLKQVGEREAHLRSNYNSLELQLKQRLADSQQLQESLADADKAAQDLQDRLRDSTEAEQQLHNQLQQHVQNEHQLQEQLQASKDSVVRLQTEVAEHKQHQQQLQKQFGEQEEKEQHLLQEHERAVQQLQQQLDDTKAGLQQELQEAQQQLGAYNGMVQQLKYHEAELQQSLQDHETKLRQQLADRAERSHAELLLQKQEREDSSLQVFHERKALADGRSREREALQQRLLGRLAEHLGQMGELVQERETQCQAHPPLLIILFLLPSSDPIPTHKGQREGRDAAGASLLRLLAAADQSRGTQQTKVVGFLK